MEGHRWRALEEPVTLSRVMQEAVGSGLRSRYKPEKEIPHQLLVLMMQINEDSRRERGSFADEGGRGRLDGRDS
jgi:hypothetical protein